MRWISLALLLLAACAHKPAAGGEMVTLLSRYHAETPDDPAVIYVMARVHEQAGDVKAALVWLGKLEAGGFDDALEPTDFPRTLATAEGKALADRLSRRARVVVRSEVARRISGEELRPEGHAYDAKRGRVLISSGKLRKVVAVDADGRLADVTRPAQDGLLAVLGMKVDEGRDWVWVASAAAAFMVPARAEEAGHSMLHAFDLQTGETRMAIAYARTPSLLNDLDLAADGSVYATDSQSGAVVVVQGGEIEDVLPPDSFEGPNGIAVAAAGDALYVADFRGVHRVELATRAVEKLPVPAPARTLGGFDGLYVRGGALIGVQNLLGRGRVWRLRLRADGRAFESAEILETGRPDYMNPTTGTFGDGAFYYLANPNVAAGGELLLLRLPLE